MTLILPPKAKTARKKQRKLRPVKTPRGDEKNYRDALFRLNKEMQESLQPVNDLLAQGAPPDILANEITRRMATSTAAYSAVAKPIASSFAKSVSSTSKKRLEDVYKSAFSVDSATIIDQANVTGAVDAAIFENTALITTIPQEYWGKVIQAVTANFRGENQVGDTTLQKRLGEVGNISDNRAKLIARDQTSKLNASVTRIRHKNSGVVKYIWRNMQDDKVVGNPSGLYPKGHRIHGNHWEREGKTYYYERPPADGHPATAIECRCFEEPILDLDNLNVVYS